MSNKTSRRVGITCMDDVLVPREYIGMEVYRHWDLISFRKSIFLPFLFCLIVSYIFHLGSFQL
jgi:hypothetical protein